MPLEFEGDVITGAALALLRRRLPQPALVEVMLSLQGDEGCPLG